MKTFLALLNQAATIAKKAYPNSKFCAADGRASHGIASQEKEVDTWRFQFLEPPPFTLTRSVLLEYLANGFGSPVLKNEPILGCEVIELPIAMELGSAIELKNKAGHSAPFKAVGLRWPLSPGNVEPLYIFTEATTTGRLILVGTKSGQVNTCDDGVSLTGR
jgi:hypothetical protein